MIKMPTFDYLRNREQGCLSGSRKRRIDLEQKLIIHNNVACSKLVNVKPNNESKAILLVISSDKTSFAVATSENTIGIYCTISGGLLYKLVGPNHTVFTICWHPNETNIIAGSDLSGDVYLWDLSQGICQSSHHIKPFQSWNWRPFLSLSYSLCFHPFSPVMTIARDREILFVNWAKGHYISGWKFFSEFSWVPWIKWSMVGGSLLASVGNPRDQCLLNPILEEINEGKFDFSPVYTGCNHDNHNEICINCDSCVKMTQLDEAPPLLEEYYVNCVDIIRYVLSRSPEWYADLFICVDCRVRFRLWANSISLVDQTTVNVTSESNNTVDSSVGDSDTRPQCQQPPNPSHSKPLGLPYDVDTSCVTVIESPIAPELVWDAIHSNSGSNNNSNDGSVAEGKNVSTNNSGPDNSALSQRYAKFVVPETENELRTECRQLLRCASMFLRECLRHSVCWCCIQHLHQWIMSHSDLRKFLYNEMLALREAVNAQVMLDETRVFDPTKGPKDHSECLKISLRNVNDAEKMEGVVDESISSITCARRQTRDGIESSSIDNSAIGPAGTNIDDQDHDATINSSKHETKESCGCTSITDLSISAVTDDNQQQEILTVEEDEDEEELDSEDFNEDEEDEDEDDKEVSNYDEDEEPPSKIGAFSFNNTCLNLSEKEIKENRRLFQLNMTLRMLKLYISEPSKLGDIIDVIMSNVNNRTRLSCDPYLNVSKIDSYSIRRWHIQSLNRACEKISPCIKCPESNVVVPSLVFSSTGLNSSSICVSHCGRKVAVLVRSDSFNRIHGTYSSTTNTNSGHSNNRKRRRHMLAFAEQTPVSHNWTSCQQLQQQHQYPVIAVYSVEPDNCCGGQLLHYCCILPYDSISLDFSPLDNTLLIGLSEHHYHHDYRIFFNNLPHTGQPAEDATRSLIVVSDNVEEEQCTSNDSSGVFAAVLDVDINHKYTDESSSSQQYPKPMSVLRYLQEKLNRPPLLSTMSTSSSSSSSPSVYSTNSINNDVGTVVTGANNNDNGLTSCVVWNPAGGLLYSRRSGGLYSVNYVGCTS